MATSNIDPEDYENPSRDRPGKEVTAGFQDKSGAFPRSSYWNLPDVNIRARGGAINDQTSASTKTARGKLTDTQLSRPTLSEPDSRQESLYPYNKVTETQSGHIIEVDDTPGHERLRVRHKTGSQIELLPDGSVRLISERDRYTLVSGKDDLVVRGTCNIVIESDANIRVQGDSTIQTDGDHNMLVHGDMSLEVRGNYTERVHGNSTKQTTGYLLTETRGNVEDRHLSNYKQRVTGTHTTNIGGDVTYTAQGNSTIILDGTLTLESEGGFIDIKTGYFHGTTAYFDDYHAEANFYGSEIHVTTGYGSTWHGALEGIAKSSQFATTAGSAPTGSASPTTPSPTSATAATEAPQSDLTATLVDGEQTETQELIKSLDRSTVNGKFQTQEIDTYAVVSRARNASLRKNKEWLQDQVNTGAITTSITSTKRVAPRRTASQEASATSGVEKISTLSAGDRNYKISSRSLLRVTAPPEQYELSGTPKASTRLSPYFYVSHFLGGDSDVGFIKESQGGVSPLEIAQNMQLVAYNILEPLRLKYKDKFTISEGLYTPYNNEKIAGDSLNIPLASGLGIGLQLSDYENSYYFDVATWIMNNLVFDKLVLSYIDYDPAEINEPTLLVTIKSGFNSGTLSTEFNHQEVSSSLQDLSS